MQAHYEIIRLAFRPGSVPAALPAIERAVTAGETRERLLAVLTSDIGTLNEVLIVQALDAGGASRNANFSHVGDQLVEMSTGRFASFPFVAPLKTGRVGPVFELREYKIRPHRLPDLLAAWEVALPARLAFSPLAFAAYALDGVQPRVLHLWPYASFEDRARLRHDAMAKGLWPPKGGPDYLVSTRSSIYLPAPFSPLL
jgi:hypothetical protein